MIEMIKVATNSSPSKVAGSLATIIREQKVVEIQTIGAGALNQAINLDQENEEYKNLLNADFC